MHKAAADGVVADSQLEVGRKLDLCGKTFKRY
jgi:hypothetical protein